MLCFAFDVQFPSNDPNPAVAEHANRRLALDGNLNPQTS